MKFMKVIVLLFVILIFLTSCYKRETIQQLDFSLYKTSEISTVSGEHIKRVEENTPFITSKDINCYTWDGKVLSININKVYEKLGEKFYYYGFVFKIKEKNVFYGAFLTPLSSYMPDKNVRRFPIKLTNQEQYLEIYKNE